MQTEERLRGEPAARSAKRGGSWAEAAPKCAGGGAPSTAPLAAPPRDAPMRRSAGAAACARTWGPAVAAPPGQSKSAARPDKTRDPCAALAARVRSADSRALYRGVAGCTRSKGSGETRPGLDRRGRLSPTSLSTCLKINCPGGMQRRDHRGIPPLYDPRRSGVRNRLFGVAEGRRSVNRSGVDSGYLARRFRRG